MTPGQGAPPAPAARVDFAAALDALDACHERAAPGAVVVSPGGWAIASAARLPGGAPVPGCPAALVAAGHRAPAAGPVLAAFADGLLRLQLGALREVLDGAVTHLGGRLSEGASLLNRQLPRGAVADVALALAEVEDLLGLPGPDGARRWRVHRELVTAGRTAIKLYGASGFAADGPGTRLYLTELLGNTYLLPSGRPARDTETEGADE